METINKKYDLKIEVLTPLSIGAGAEKDWVKGVDFVVNKGKLYKLNLRKISKEGVNIDELTPYLATKNECGVINTITEGRLDKVSDLVLTFPVNSTNDINDIKAFVKNQLTGKPILVGSSLKGAIRSILFDYLRENEQEEQQVFGDSVKGDEFMRFIKISDAEFDTTSLVNTKIFNLQKKENWIGGWKHGGKETGDKFNPTGFNTIYEALMPSDVGCASFMVSNQFLEVDWRRFYDQWQRETRKDAEKETIKHLIAKVESKKTLLRDENSLNILFKVINNHTKEYLKKEKAFFEEYSADKTNLIVDSINNLLNLIPSDNSYCILKMSAGSGFHSITGDWQSDDYSNGQFDRKRADKKDLKIPGKILPKSRKIAVWENHFDLMGFVKLTAISEEEKEKERLAREAIAREQAEKERKQKEEQERLENELKKREEEFARLYKLAEDAYSAEQWSEVLQYVESAVCIFPDRLSRFDSLKSIANENIKLQEQQKLVEEAKRKEEEERRIANEIPLAEKIAGASKIPTLCGNTKQWMKQNSLESLSDEDKQVLKSKLLDLCESMKEKEVKKQISSALKDLKTVLGQDLAQQWFNEIVNK